MEPGIWHGSKLNSCGHGNRFRASELPPSLLPNSSAGRWPRARVSVVVKPVFALQALRLLRWPLARTGSFRMRAVSASFYGVTGCGELPMYRVRVEARRDEGGHGDRACRGPGGRLPVAADDGVAGPASGWARDGRKACKARGLAGFEGSELGHFDQQSEGGDRRDARMLVRIAKRPSAS
jgi:hypothetical protein